MRRRRGISAAALAPALAAVLAAAAPAFPQDAAPERAPDKICGDPRLVGDEPCLPPVWCDGPNGTYPGRLDGSCHPEDAENGPPPPEQQVKRGRTIEVPDFSCAPGYTPVLALDGRPLCAAELAYPLR